MQYKLLQAVAYLCASGNKTNSFASFVQGLENEMNIIFNFFVLAASHKRQTAKKPTPH